MKFLSNILLLAFITTSFSAISQSESLALSKINTQGFQQSQVMDLISDLSDVHGPRLTGTNQYYAAAQWAKKTMEGRQINKKY